MKRDENTLVDQARSTAPAGPSEEVLSAERAHACLEETGHCNFCR